MRVLLVEDELDLAASLCKALGRKDIIVDHVITLAAADAAVRAGPYDAALVGRTLPDGEGLSLIQQWRQGGVNMPIIVLSAQSAVDSRIEGLDVCADDYVAKPFAISELLARLRAVLRRPARLEVPLIRIGRLSVDLACLDVRINTEVLSLPRREILALTTLARRVGRTVTRQVLEDAVYGFDDEIASNSLDAHISRLRHKISAAGVEIHAVRGLGYVLRAHQELN